MTLKQRKTTKSTRVMESIRNDILSGALAPGEKLQMDILKERYGIGYSPLREALSRLASLGLVHSEEQCGFEVASQSLEELHDLYQIRAYIDTIALELSIQKGDERWEADIVSSWYCFSRLLDPAQKSKIETHDWERLQRNFLYSLIKGCGSPWLLKIHMMLYDQAQRYRAICINHHAKDKKMLQNYRLECQRLVDAVLARDTVKAIRISRASWENTVKGIAEVIERQTSSRDP
ncbi:hypothetical protein AQUSIP_25490 [Aquicella siphonis]|uniref:HTH gntR-type domain-containing protein n=1 Tax=Aquicella siphonis TaxID=254247 RepID=A0A5E4PLU2_9COXI|nr:GntR family transcriptional regulator [Aquicella siphonis]VVC77222.1 hypothetical protein AQUSIP_25490 [Aquicella siphonis]